MPVSNTQPIRAVGLVAIASGITSIALLANHPGGQAHDFAGVLKNEASHQLADAIVHGGFIVVLAVQFVCYAIFSAHLGMWRTSVITGLVFFAVGSMFLSGSMTLDGLVTPALAVKYLATPDKAEFAKSSLVLVGALIRFLMPIGVAFQSIGIAGWGWALFASRRSRVAGIIGLAIGVGAFLALVSTATTMNPIVLMGAIAGTTLWAITVGTVFARNAATPACRE